jgi:hypothetical protein
VGDFLPASPPEQQNGLTYPTPSARLAFEWPGGGVLFRAERQTVIRAAATWDPPAPPADPAGWLAARPIVNPRGAAPTHLDLPEAVPPTVELADDAGYCMLDHGNIVPVSETVLVGAF